VQPGVVVKRACGAGAGRVDDGEVKITNNPWEISARRLERELGLDSVHLVNDFAALSMGVPLLERQDGVVIGEVRCPKLGTDKPQCFAVIGPGTGLGVGGLIIRDGTCSVLETEGGHAGFAAHTAEDIEILKRLNIKFGRVSNERLICGAGLVNLYGALCDIAGKVADDLKPEDVTSRAEDKSDPMCVKTVECFAAILGSVAGDLVLTLGAWDGVYIAGGLLPIMLPWMQEGTFRERFEEKGRFKATMKKVPTIGIVHHDPGLLGAAALAVIDAGLPLLNR
jgi:glucokinase